MKKYITILALAALMASCGTSRKAQDGTDITKTVQATGENSDAARLKYVHKVNDNAVYAKDIVSKMDLTIDAMGKHITVDGKIYMRKDEVIRLVISPLGLMEVGRLEFTPDYVMIVNRLEKEYTKATYSDLDFLKNNGVTFYTLQSLFWNQLFMPGKNSLGEGDIAKFGADMTQTQQRHITLKQNSLLLDWTTDVARALISKAAITYGKGTAQASNMDFDYADFVPVGSKMFPSKVSMSFNSKAVNSGKMTLTVKMNKVTNDSGWESKTTLSGKYTEVKAETLFRKLVNM